MDGYCHLYVIYTWGFIPIYSKFKPYNRSGEINRVRIPICLFSISIFNFSLTNQLN